MDLYYTKNSILKVIVYYKSVKSKKWDNIGTLGLKIKISGISTDF